MNELDKFNCAINFDPTKHYEHMSIQDILASCGPLPFYVINSEYKDLSLKEAMEAQYNFGSLFELTTGRVDEKGVWYYPGDPPLYPFLEIRRNNEVYYQYPYAFVCFRSRQGDFFSRMD